MTESYQAKLEAYLFAMIQAKRLLTRGVFTLDDYTKIDTIITEKYGISSCSIYRGIDLIYSAFRGNINTEPK